MNTKDFLNKVAYIKQHDDVKSDCYFSLFDDSYITHVGMESNIKYLADHEITDCLKHGTGFSQKDGKWYGWSHRAIFGFEIGSEVKRGDCAYKPSTKYSFAESLVDWHHDKEFHIKSWYEFGLSGNGDDGVVVFSLYNDKVPNEKMRGVTINRHAPYPDTFGRGEWIAETLEDAMEMAIDFNESVS